MSPELLGRCTFPPAGTAVVCAFSGGADSTALVALAIEAGLSVTAFHVDHGLQPGSDTMAGVAHRNAERMGATFRSERVQIEAGPNLEARARAARYSVLPPGALLGHTADDQAETVLLHLLRGAGLHGLAGMRTDDGRRPILSLRRSETEALCADLGLEVVRDPSNDDPSFRRNRIRHELVPLLDDIAERDVVPLLARLAGVARASVDHLDLEAAELDVLDGGALVASPPVLARLAIRSWLQGTDPDGQPPDAATIERVLRVADCQLGATDVGGGRQVRRTGRRLRIETTAR